MIINISIVKLQNYALLLILLLCTKRLILWLTRRQTKVPPSPFKLPLIGNLHQFGSNPHQSLAALSQKHGPLMMLQLGQVQTLVVSSAEFAKDVLRTYDHIFASRPLLMTAYINFYQCKDVVFAPNGEYWRQMKKLCTMNLLSSKAVKSFQHAREEEVAFMIAKVAKACASSKDSVIDMTKVFSAYSNDVMYRAVLGKLLREENMNGVFKELIEALVAMFGEFFVADYFPSFAWLDKLLGATKKGKLLAKRWDELLEKMIQVHVDRKNHSSEQERDFVDVLLEAQEESKNGDEEITTSDIKGILVDMFAAGIDTTYVTQVWALSELVRKPEAMKKLQDEVRGIAKVKGSIDEEQLCRMSYLKAVIKETLRLHPAVPLLIMRESLEDCKIGDYVIPKKTRVIVNEWAICRDAKYWDAPEEFKPERFLTNSELDYKGTHFQFTPFGAGRRICPGMQFASCSMELVIANLMQQFDWELPNGMKSEDLDMTEIPGISTRKKERLELVVKPFFN